MRETPRRAWPMPDALAVRIGQVVTLEEAARLGFAGWLARGTGRTDPRPQGEQLHHRLRDGALREAAREVSAACDAAGIPHVIARGAALLGDLYAPGDREVADIDCHVPAASAEAALRLLAHLGFHPDESHASPSGMGRGCTCTRGGGLPVTVDLHWGLARADRLITYGEDAVPEEVWAHSTVVGGVRVPDPPAHLAFVLHHLVHHDLLHARGLIDAMALWSRLPSEERGRLEGLARRWRIARVANALPRVVDAGPRSPSGVAGLLIPECVMRAALRAGPRESQTISLRRLRRRLHLLDHRVAAVRMLRDVVLPPVPYLRWRWPGRSVPAAWWQHVRRQALRVIFPQ